MKFMSLKAAGLSDSYDAKVHGVKPVVDIKTEKDRIEVSYIFPGFTISDVGQMLDDETMPFQEVGISGSGFLSESGKPLLPSFGRFLQIPAGYDYKVVTKTARPVQFEDVLITPAQELATDGDDHEYEFDKRSYSKDAFYPEELVEVGKPQVMDDYLVLLIHVRPLQYNAKKRILRGYSNITVTVQLTPAKKADVDFPVYDPVTNREGFGNLVINPDRTTLATTVPVGVVRPVRTGVLVPSGPEFLIIHADGLKDAATKLADWKNTRGLKTETVSIGSVGNTVDKIKKYIRDRRKFLLSRLRYVLLMGDVNLIRSEERDGSTTDHYYYTKNDPANNSDCVMAWVSGGRIPVSTLDDANCVVDQIISYEKNPPCDPAYYKRMAFAAYFQDNAPQDGRADRAYMKTMESIRTHLVSQGIEIDRAYVSSNPNPMQYKDGTNVPQDVKDAIVDGDTATELLIANTAEGNLIIGHRDHGNTDGWSEPSFKTTDLDSISSHNPSLFFSINCLTGQFDANPTDSFAEALLKMDGGAPSLIAATEVSGTWRNDSMIKALFDTVWPGVISTFPGTTSSYPIRHNRLGDMLNYSKSYLLVAHGTNSGVKNHFEIYHVVGDPTIELRTSAPISIRLGVVLTNGILNLSLDSCPADAVVTVWKGDKLLKTINPRFTRFTLPLRDLGLVSSGVPTKRNVVKVCFSAPGYRHVSRFVNY